MIRPARGPLFRLSGFRPPYLRLPSLSLRGLSVRGLAVPGLRSAVLGLSGRWFTGARPTVTAAAIPFQDDLDRLVAEPAPLLLRLWPLLGALLLAGLLALAARAQVDIVVVATGRLAADVPPISLQPMNRATLRDLSVQPGDLVAAGQILARLDPTIPEADRAAIAAQWRAVVAEEARLRAELAGQPLAGQPPAGQPPAGQPPAGQPLAGNALAGNAVAGHALAPRNPDMDLQAGVQAGRAALADAQRAGMQADLAALAGALAAEQAAGQGLADRLDIAREVETMRLELAARQSGSHLAVLEAKAARLDAEAALRQHHARIGDLEQAMAAARSGLAAFGLDLRRAAMEQLARLAPQRAQLEEQLAKADRLSALSVLRAPVAAVVLTVAPGGPGSMMREGEPVVVLVPVDVPLVAEVGIRSAEVGALGLGDPVAVKVDAFPWRRYGTLTGRLADVGAASYQPQGAPAALHAGRITLAGRLAGLPPGTKLLPGMTLTAEIKTGTRSVLDYFLDPLLRGLNESLREP